MYGDYVVVGGTPDPEIQALSIEEARAVVGITALAAVLSYIETDDKAGFWLPVLIALLYCVAAGPADKKGGG